MFRLIEGVFHEIAQSTGNMLIESSGGDSPTEQEKPEGEEEEAEHMDGAALHGSLKNRKTFQMSVREKKVPPQILHLS